MTRKMTENDNSVRGLWDMPVLTVTVGTDTGLGRREKMCLLESYWKLPESEKKYTFTQVNRATKSKCKK